jgi:hypothetical protein
MNAVEKVPRAALRFERVSEAVTDTGIPTRGAEMSPKDSDAPPPTWVILPMRPTQCARSLAGRRKASGSHTRSPFAIVDAQAMSVLRWNVSNAVVATRENT